MANLATLNGISDARNDLYAKLESGAIDERRAAQMERVLRGQTDLKATVPLRLLNIITRTKGTTAERYAAPILLAIHKFTTGNDLVLPDEETAPTGTAAIVPKR